VPYFTSTLGVSRRRHSTASPYSAVGLGAIF
jgi:hypothetical protein